MNILKAVLSINPEAQLDVYEENIKTINWRGGTEPIPEAEIQAEMERLQAEYDALQYQRDRKPEYPSMADQLDYIYHNGIDKWKSDMVKPVKDAHPKP
jgi:predicted lipoprotein